MNGALIISCSCLDDDVYKLRFVPRYCTRACCYSPSTSIVMAHLIWSPLRDLVMPLWLGFH